MESQGGHHHPDRQQLMVRLPADLYRWLHRTSVLERQSKLDIALEAIRWIQSQKDGPGRLREVALAADAGRRSTAFELPREIHAWLRIESSEYHWSANEFVTRILTAWRKEREEREPN